jgi:hypothetical protein
VHTRRWLRVRQRLDDGVRVAVPRWHVLAWRQRTVLGVQPRLRVSRGLAGGGTARGSVPCGSLLAGGRDVVQRLHRRPRLRVWRRVDQRRWLAVWRWQIQLWRHGGVHQLQRRLRMRRGVHRRDAGREHLRRGQVQRRGCDGVS